MRSVILLLATVSLMGCVSTRIIEGPLAEADLSVINSHCADGCSAEVVFREAAHHIDMSEDPDSIYHRLRQRYVRLRLKDSRVLTGQVSRLAADPRIYLVGPAIHRGSVSDTVHFRVSSVDSAWVAGRSVRVKSHQIQANAEVLHLGPEGVILTSSVDLVKLRIEANRDQGELTVGLFAGRSSYDLSGTGWTTVVGPRVDYLFFYPLAVQFAVPVYSYKPWFSDRITHLFPELSLLVRPRIGRVLPYLGLGAGWSFVVVGRGGDSAPTLNIAAGVRVQLSRYWDLRSEFGLRSVDPWHGVTADITGGIGYRS